MLAWQVIFAALLVASPALAEESWATTRARELVEQGRRQADGGHLDVATARFREAVQMDSTFGPAYLAWGALLEAARDDAEAERVYAMGIAHVARFADGYAARGKLRARQRRFEEATRDLRAAARLRPDDLPLLGALGEALLREGAWPAALAVQRTLLRLATEQGEIEAARRAAVQIRALMTLLGELDPVVAGARDRGEVRSAVARWARGG